MRPLPATSAILTAMDLSHVLTKHGGLLPAKALPRRVLTRAVRAGTLRRVARGWYATDPDHPGAGVVGSGCELGCVTALRSYGVWGTDRSLHIHIPHSSAGRGLPDGIRHWSHAPRLTGWRAGVPLSVFQACCCLPSEEAIASVDSALHLGLLTLEEWRDLCAAHPVRLHGLRDLVDSRAESGLETLARLRLARHRPEVQSQIGPWRVDLRIGSICVELDGFAFHRDQFDADRRRDAELTARGFTVLRFSYEQVMFRFAEIDRAVDAAVGTGEKQAVAAIRAENRPYGA
ncbi:MAG: endonuclease domain-containing protein [Microbacteriaceae bacterium]|jgi:very-short-patch-repair endonuclease|nr:endonuclease domain-containing protein [Microbacteriaceae bacterium]